MKKSFIFGITVVLTLLLVFAGCSQSPSSSDDDDDITDSSSKPQVSLQNDLAAIAAAFSDGATEVTVKSDLYLNDGELVIPFGGTLVFSGASIKGLTDNSKLIGAGKLNYPSGTVDFTTRPGAKLIVTEEFRGAYIRLSDEPTDTRPILANSGQIVYIQPRFEDFMTYVSTGERPSPIFGSYDQILALRAPVDGNITVEQAKALRENTNGLKVYIVGKVKFLSDITLKNEYPGTIPPPPASSESRGILANYNNDLDEKDVNTLVVAGDVDVNGYCVDADGFTVWGALLDATPPTGKVLTTATTPLVAYTAQLTRPIFEGPVHLYAPIVNGFDNTVTFKNDVIIDGPAAFTEALFAGNATFNGHVSFTDPGATGIVFGGPDDGSPPNEITFNSGAEFASDFKLLNDNGYKAGSVSFVVRGNAPVKFSYNPSVEIFEKILEGVNFDDENVGVGRIELSPKTTTLDKYIYYKNVTVRPTVTIGTAATFAGKTVFEKDVTFGTQGIAFGTEGASAAVPSELIVKGEAKFTETANFGSTSYNINNFVFGTSATNIAFGLGTASSADGENVTRIIGKASFTNGVYTDIGTQGVLIGGILFKADDDSADGTASVVVAKDETVYIDNAGIAVTGTGSLINTVVTLKSDQSINLVYRKDEPHSQLVFYEEDGITPVEPAGIRIVGILTKSGSFKVAGASVDLNKGELMGLNNSVTVTVGANTNLVVPLQTTLEIGTASLTVANGGSITLGGTAAGAGAGSFSAIHLVNGTLSTGSTKTKKAYGGDAYIVAGSTANASVSYPMALIGSASNGSWGTYSSNIITTAISFVGSEGLTAGSIAAISADEEVEPSKIVFGPLAN
jgi:hypothetical protein